MRKRMIILLSLLLVMALFSACGIRLPKYDIKFSDRWSSSHENKVSKERMEKVVKAIKNQNKKAIKGMFSKKSLIEIENIDSLIDAFMEYFTDDAVVKYSGEWYTATNDMEDGEYSEVISSGLIIYTEKKEIFLYLQDCTQDTQNPDNVGLISISIAETENSEKPLNIDYEKVEDSGIYLY